MEFKGLHQPDNNVDFKVQYRFSHLI